MESETNSVFKNQAARLSIRESARLSLRNRHRPGRGKHCLGKHRTKMSEISTKFTTPKIANALKPINNLPILGQIEMRPL
jgi:hypothetical protein